MKPRTLWDCHPVIAMMALSVAPDDPLSSAMTLAAFVPSRAAGAFG
jgi:hypothetical protein